MVTANFSSWDDAPEAVGLKLGNGPIKRQPAPAGLGSGMALTAGGEKPRSVAFPEW
jgi:hypothetical protein